MKKYDEKEQVSELKANLVNDLYEMLPFSLQCTNVCLITKDGEENEYYQRMFGNTLADMDEEELSFIKDYFGYLLGYTTLRHIEKEDAKTYEILMAILHSETMAIDNARYINNFIIDFNKKEVYIGMTDSLYDDVDDYTKAITINHKKEIVFSQGI